MRIILTGTPGTGKTMVAAWLSKQLGYSLVSITDFVNSKKLYQKSSAAKEVDTGKLQRAILPIVKRQKNLVIEGHLACEIKLPADYVIVLRCNPKTLLARLKKRHYPAKKLHENIMAELLDYSTQLAEKHYKCPVLELETAGKTVARSGKEILAAIKQKKKKLNYINYNKALLRELKLI